MIQPLDDEQSRNGTFRGLLRTGEGSISECAAALWASLPEPKRDSAETLARHCNFTSHGQAVLRDLLLLMFSEQAQYLQRIRAHFGSYSEAADSGIAMMIDNRVNTAWYLAARRAEARLRLEEPPVIWDQLDEEWMRLPSASKVDNFAEPRRK